MLPPLAVLIEVRSDCGNQAFVDRLKGLLTAKPLSPFRTDAVSRGRSISIFTLEIISCAISNLLFFFTVPPS
jgi:hypothetical protein